MRSPSHLVASGLVQLDDTPADPCGDLAIDPDELLVNGVHQIQVDYEGTAT